MADVKISALPASTTPLAGTEVLPIVQSSTTRQVSVANLTAGRSVGGTDFIPSGSSAPTNGMYLPAANTLGFSTNSTEQMRIESGGSVKLKAGNLYWDEAGTRYISNVGDSSSNINIQSRGYTTFSTGGATVGAGTEYMRITSAGDVGVGTSSPGTYGKLTVLGSTAGNATAAPTLLAVINNGSNYTAKIVLSDGNTNSGFVTYTGGASAAAQILGLGVGTPNQVNIDGNGLLTANNANNTGALWGECTSATFTDVVIRARAARNTTNGTFTAIEYYNTGAAAFKFYVIDSGAIYSTSIVITAISDERLKENIRDIDTGLSTIMALKPRRFDWKDGKGQDKKNVAGFIAQEFETVFPESVGTSKAGGDGIEYKNINHETLIPTLVKAMQEQQLLIESLTTRLTALENK